MVLAGGDDLAVQGLQVDAKLTGVVIADLELGPSPCSQVLAVSALVSPDAVVPANHLVVGAHNRCRRRCPQLSIAGKPTFSCTRPGARLILFRSGSQARDYSGRTKGRSSFGALATPSLTVYNTVSPATPETSNNKLVLPETMSKPVASASP